MIKDRCAAVSGVTESEMTEPLNKSISIRRLSFCPARGHTECPRGKEIRKPRGSGGGMRRRPTHRRTIPPSS